MNPWKTIVKGLFIVLAIFLLGVFVWKHMGQDTQDIVTAPIVKKSERLASQAPVLQFNSAGCVLQRQTITVSTEQMKTLGKEGCQIAFEVISDGTIQLWSMDSSGKMILRESRFGRGDVINVGWSAYQNKMYVKANRGSVSFRFRFCPQNAEFDPAGCLWKGQLYRFTLSSSTGATAPVEERNIGSPTWDPRYFFILISWYFFLCSSSR